MHLSSFTKSYIKHPYHFPLGPPYDSNENEEYPQNQQNNERLRDNYNNRNPTHTNLNRDNFRFPQNNENEFNNRRPQVRYLKSHEKLLIKLSAIFFTLAIPSK